MTQKLTNAARAALKTAISTHPDWNQYRHTVLNGANTGQLTKQQLLETATALSIDINAVIALADNTTENSDNAPEPCETTETNMPETTETAQDESKDISQTPMLDAAISKAKTVLADTSPFLGDKLLKPIETAIAHMAAAARSEINNVVPMTAAPAGSLPQARPVSLEKVGNLFPIKSTTLYNREIRVWNAQNAPKADADFAFVDDLLEDIITSVNRSDTIWLAGAKGTGKTSLPREIAARTGRPFVRIAHHRTTEPVELIGSMYPSEDGGVTWKDGVLTAAIRRAGTIIVLDEPTFCRAGVLALYQTLLDHRFLTLAENGGEVVPVAQGVTFVIADNTAGNGDSTGRYADTNSMNAAFLDRATKILKVDYLPRDKEIAVLSAKTGCPQRVAEMIVDFAAKTRKAGDQGDITEGLSFRRMFAFANDLQDGIPARRAFDNCVISHAPADDAVALNELAKAHLSFSELSMSRKAGNMSKTVQPASNKAPEFDPVSL